MRETDRQTEREIERQRQRDRERDRVRKRDRQTERKREREKQRERIVTQKLYFPRMCQGLSVNLLSVTSSCPWRHPEVRHCRFRDAGSQPGFSLRTSNCSLNNPRPSKKVRMHAVHSVSWRPRGPRPGQCLQQETQHDHRIRMAVSARENNMTTGLTWSMSATGNTT